MPELMSAWVTLAASTRGMESDIRRGIQRATGQAEIRPKIDSTRLAREGDTAGRRFAQRFQAASSSGAAAGGRAAGAAFTGGFAALLTGGALVGAARLAVSQVQGVLEEGLDFSRTMNNFQGVTRSSAAEMAQMQSAAKALGSDTKLAGASASGAATAMTELAKAGFTVEESIAAARGTLQLATAGQIEAAQAAEIQANAMNAYGLGAESAAHTADLLANAAIASSADIPDLGLALQQVGGIAHGFGVSLDDTIAALGMFANAGVKGSDAGTLLKTTMQSITDQGNPAQGAIEQLGLELYKLNEAGDNQFVGFRGPDGLFAQLDEAKRRLDNPEQFQALTNILFGSDAMRSAMLGNAEAYDEMYGKLQRVGAAGEMASAQMQGLPGAVEAFKNTAESIKLDAFESLGPAATQILNDLVEGVGNNKAEIVEVFNTIGSASITMAQTVVASVGGMSGILGDVADFFGMDDWANSLRNIEGGADGVFNILAEGKDTLQAMATRTAEADRFTKALGTSIGSLKAVGDAVTIDVKDNTPEVRAKVEGLGGYLRQMANDPTRLEIVPGTPEAAAQMQAWRQEEQGQPLLIGAQIVEQQSQEFAPAWLKYIGGQLGPAPLPVSIIPSGPASLPAPTGGPPVNLPGSGPAPRPNSAPPIPMPRFPAPRAAGGVFSAMPSSAVIQPATPGLIQWAEPSTGGEAFIPLAGGQRSFDIWAQTGKLLGVFDRGGFNNVDEAILANVPSGQYTQSARGDLTQGLADCSSAVEDLVNILDGNTTAGASMSTGNAAEWLAARGFVQGEGGLGDMRVAFNSGHMQATLPGGTPFNWGSSEAAARGGRGGSGADDPALTSRWYRPVAGAHGAGYGLDAPYGYGPVDPDKVADAERKLRDAQADVAIQEQQVRELKDDASESARMSAEDQARRAREDRDEAQRELEAARRGEPLDESDLRSGRSKSTSGGNGLGENFGQSIFSGLLQGIGLDGSVFSNPFEWPNVKSGIAALNWGGGLLKGLLGGGTDEAGAPLGSSGPTIGGLTLPGLSELTTPFGRGPTAATPLQQPNIAAGVGSGPAPGPLVQYNGPVHMGVDPRAMTQRQDAHLNQAYRRNMNSVRPGGGG